MLVDEMTEILNPSPDEEVRIVERGLSNGWVQSFLKRNSSLKSTPVNKIDRARLDNATPEKINGYFDMLEELFLRHHYHPSVIGNFDETMLQESSKKLRVIVSRDSLPPLEGKATGVPHITLGVNIFADGSHLPTILIFPSKTLPSEINLATMDDYLDSSIAGQDSGWMTAKLLEEYCKETIIPEYKKRLSPLGPNARGLFILDGHSSRANPDLLETFSAANVDVVTFVSHTSHVCQPLDLVIFGTFKSQLTKANLSFRKASSSEKRRSLVTSALRCLHAALYPADVKTAFTKAGIWPLDRTPVLSNKFVRDALQPSPVAESSPRKRNAVDINNKVISHPEIISQLRSQAKKKSKPIPADPTPAQPRTTPQTIPQRLASPVSPVIPVAPVEEETKKANQQISTSESISKPSENACDELGPSYHIVVTQKRKRGRPRKSPVLDQCSLVSECVSQILAPPVESMDVDLPIAS